MTHLELAALRDAEAEYLEDRRPIEIRIEQCAQVRGGLSAGPAAEALALVGREALCRIWGVDHALWDERSAEWFRTYNLTWCSTIEAMIEHDMEQR